MSLTEDTILQRVVVRRTAQKRAPMYGSRLKWVLYGPKVQLQREVLTIKNFSEELMKEFWTESNKFWIVISLFSPHCRIKLSQTDDMMQYLQLKVDRAFVAKNTIDQTIIEKETGINTFKIYFANEEIYSKFPDKEIRIFRSEQKGTVVFLSQDQDQLSQIHLKPSRFKIFDNNNEQVTFDYIAEVASNFEALYHSFLRSLPIPLDKVDHN
jgi:hypothetical protein